MIRKLKLIALVVVALVIVLVVAWWRYTKPPVTVTLTPPNNEAASAESQVPIPELPALSESDTTTAITGDLDKTEIGDIDRALAPVDSEIEKLK
ncbi:MAG: hypothetical protein V1723_00945 [Candidatus Uhrbacteria bacterium]